MTFDIRCNTCGKFMMPKPGDGWECHGEFGEEVEYVCAGCISRGTKLQAGNGTSDPRWCGVIASPVGTGSKT